MYSAKSYELTVQEYNYLLPVLRPKLLYLNNRYYFIGLSEELDDMLNRLKGLYNFYNELNSIDIYNCFKNGSLKPIRDKLQKFDK